MIIRRVIRHTTRPSGGKRVITHGGGGFSLPREGLLFFSWLPNTEGVLWADDQVIDDEYYVFGGWVLPASNSDVFTATGLDWYTDVNTPKVLRDTEILALAGINTTNVFFSMRRGLAVYETTISVEILARIKKYYGIA